MKRTKKRKKNSKKRYKSLAKKSFVDNKKKTTSWHFICTHFVNIWWWCMKAK